MIKEVLCDFGLSEKEIQVYLALLKLGPSSVRKIAQEAGVNRGTTYDVLKSLQALRLVSYYHKDTHQYFFAEDPQKILSVLEERRKKLQSLEHNIEEALPELKSIYKDGVKPAARYYEGYDGIKKILEHVLEVVAQSRDKTYFVYSSSVRDYLYKNWKSYNNERVRRGIKNKVISIGKGGEFAGLDERKWLTKKEEKEDHSYMLIYDGYVSMISLNKDGIPVGVVIEDRSTYKTQKMIFEFVWKKL